MKQHATRHNHISTRQACGESKLERIAGPDGRMTRPMTAKQQHLWIKVGTHVDQKWCAWRKHLKRDWSINHVKPFFFCSICKMPLCRENKVNPEAGRAMIFLEDHEHSDESHFCCNDLIRCKNFPKDKILNVHPLRSSKQRKKRHWNLPHEFVVVFCC